MTRSLRASDVSKKILADDQFLSRHELNYIEPVTVEENLQPHRSITSSITNYLKDLFLKLHAVK